MIATTRRSHMVIPGAARARALRQGAIARGRGYVRAVQVGAAILVGQIGAPGDDTPLREPYPIVRVAEDVPPAFARGERVERLILTQPLDCASASGEGSPGDAPN